jgi:hypothetical protein
MTARAQRNERRAAKDERNCAAGSEPEIIAARLSSGNDRKGVSARKHQRIIAQL